MTNGTDTGIWAFLGFVTIFVAVEIFKKALTRGFKRLFKRSELRPSSLKGRPPEIRPETRFRIRGPK
jgi:hypothetical protein